MQLGLYLPEVPSRLEELDRWLELLGGQLSIASIYQAWGSTDDGAFPTEALRRVVARGLTPMITWEPWQLPERGVSSTEQPTLSLRRVAGGAHDAYVRAWARACGASSIPLLLRPMHEMNGDWYPWAGTVNGNRPEDYVAAWHHLRAIFRDEGANAVQWVWCPYVSSHPNSTDNSLAAYFPGDDAVDWVALDAYNWGTREPRFRWQHFDELFADAYQRVSALSTRPMMIAELGCAEEGGSKAQWIGDMKSALRAHYPRVSALVWFQVEKERDWRIDSSPAALAAFLERTSAQ
jgi:beta-mannanase